MMAPTHVLIAAAGLVAYSTSTHTPLTGLVWGTALFGSLAPDLDHGKALISKLTNRGWAPMLRHRHILHTPEILPLIYFLGYQWFGPGLTTWALTFGYASHLLADALTPERIPLLFFSKGRYGLGIVHTGGVLEWLLRVSLVAGMGWMTFRNGLPVLQ